MEGLNHDVILVSTIPVYSCRNLLHDLLEFAGGVAAGHFFQRNGFDLAGVAGRTELLVAGDADLLGGLTRGLEVFTRVKLRGILGQETADGTRHRETDVGINVDLAHAIFDGFLDFLDGYTVGFLHVATELADFGQQFLGNAGAAVHDQVGVGQAGVDFLDALNRQDVARGLARELVGAVAGADGDGQRIELGAAHEIRSLFRVGQQLVARHGAFRAVAVFLVTHHGLERTQATELAFDGDAQLVSDLDHLASDFDVVFVIG